MEAETSAPLPLWIIAIAALSPFPVSAAIYAFGPDRLAHDALTVILTWSAIVMSFVGGVRWGLETGRESPRTARLASSIIGPVFAWILKDGHTENWTLYDLSDRLRMKGWLVPAYPMADDLGDMTLQRIVVRAGLSHDLATRLLSDLKAEVKILDAMHNPVEGTQKSGFHH